MSDATKAVFLSYASQDKEAAGKICDALRAAGVEVWFDQSELRGGDAWDAKIRKQIKECALFVPIISANTNSRPEGYFRLEWKLAVDRSHLLADDHPFLFPVLIDDLPEATARVPDKFRDVQWTRLNVKDTPPMLAARVAKLLAGENSGDRGRATADRGSGDGGRRDSGRHRPAWLRTAWAVVGLALAAYYGLQPLWRSLRRRDEPRPPAASAPLTTPVAMPGTAPAAAPLSEARQLVAKARDLMELLDSTHDDYKLTGELLAQAKAKDAADAEVWAAEAQLHWRYIIRGWDFSDARREAARAATQRALRLDPQSFEARFAQAALLAYTGREGTEKVKILRELRQERPADRRVLHELGETIERQGRVDEGVAFFDEAAALPGGDPLALYNKSLSFWFAGRTVEAEAAMRAAVAQKPFTGALLMNVWYAIILHGDLAGAQATLDRIPPADMVEDRACFFAFYLHYLRREPAAALNSLNAIPRDWLNDNWYTGPKGRLTGDALQLAGRAEAAAAEWRAALKLVEARLVADPTNSTLLFNRMNLLAKLGERDEAARQFAVLLQMDGIDLAGDKPLPTWVANVCILLGRKEEAIRQIRASFKRQSHAVEHTAAKLKLDPLFDPLRGEPEFPKLITEAEAIEHARTSPAAPAAKP